LKKLIFIALLPISTLAQDFAFTDTVFLDRNWIETQNRKEALYYRGVKPSKNDSTYLVHDFYIDNGSIQMRGTYKYEIKHGNQNGKFEFYYKNGNLKASYYYVNGKFEGKSTRYYENGNIESIEKFCNGKLCDTLRYFYENGAPHEVKFVNQNFDSDNLAEAEKEFLILYHWDVKGNLQITNGYGTKVDYYSNGKKRTSIEYVNGYPHGEWLQYTNKKKLKSKMIFKNGLFISGVMYQKRKKDIFATLYREPRYPNGIKALDDFVSKNTNKCKEFIKSEVLVMITVSETGDAQFEQILSGDVSHCQYDELTEMVKHMPKWLPAIRYGNYVESTYIIRVRY